MISTTQLLQVLQSKKTLPLDTLLKEIPDLTFSKYIQSMLESKNLSKSDVIQKTTLQRNYAYQIFDGSRKPGKDKVLQLCLAMKLTLKETDHLLSLSDNGSLYPKVKRDALLIYALNREMSVIDTNVLLSEYKLPILE